MQNYTQYIPLSIYDLQYWMGSPSIYVYDCSQAGQCISHNTHTHTPLHLLPLPPFISVFSLTYTHRYTH